MKPWERVPPDCNTPPSQKRLTSISIQIDMAEPIVWTLAVTAKWNIAQLYIHLLFFFYKKQQLANPIDLWIYDNFDPKRNWTLSAGDSPMSTIILNMNQWLTQYQFRETRQQIWLHSPIIVDNTVSLWKQYAMTHSKDVSWILYISNIRTPVVLCLARHRWFKK